jgi:hypothetical protein
VLLGCYYSAYLVVVLLLGCFAGCLPAAIPPGAISRVPRPACTDLAALSFPTLDIISQIYGGYLRDIPNPIHLLGDLLYVALVSTLYLGSFSRRDVVFGMLTMSPRCNTPKTTNGSLRSYLMRERRKCSQLPGVSRSKER